MAVVNFTYFPLDYTPNMAYNDSRMLKQFHEIRGSQVFLSDEAAEHIKKDHPEISMEMLGACIGNPDVIVASRHHEKSELYFLLRQNKMDKPRFTLVVVKECPGGLFISTAMTKSNITKGKIVYKKEGFDENLL